VKSLEAYKRENAAAAARAKYERRVRVAKLRASIRTLVQTSGCPKPEQAQALAEVLAMMVKP
jgi:hypothetical protein